MEAHAVDVEQPFIAAIEAFFDLVDDLQTPESHAWDLSTSEATIETKGREVLRRLLEEHLRLRGLGSRGEAVTGRDGKIRSHLRERPRRLRTIFGDVETTRLGYGARGHVSLFPKDAELNLPTGVYSHTLERKVAERAAKVSFENTLGEMVDATGVSIPKRQAEELAQEAARDFDEFYAQRSAAAIQKDILQLPIQVLTTDGKGIVMRTEDLREPTKKRAESSEHKLKTRLSRGEKRNAKRMAQVASVYNIDKHIRSPEDILNRVKATTPPRPVQKRVWASVEKDADLVVKDMFAEAATRDPDHAKKWVVLVDGQPHQLGLIKANLKERSIKAPIIVDIVHVIEYLWKTARCFFEETSQEAEDWVGSHLLMVLEGKAKLVAAGIRRSATNRDLKSEDRGPVDKCAEYLHNNAKHMQYDKYLKNGYPIATGVIEGACRYLIKDRLDITGARWGIKCAEAVLRLRSIQSSGDWTKYWKFHERKEYERNHAAHYANRAVPRRLTLRVVM